uniref:Uncharacterized protein n=1 Tax=viral metagenome TaxID=1070528 RepID=A0A6M3L9Z8_9ZZZZ
MTDKLWKQTERRIAKLLGAGRNPVGTGKADANSSWLQIEVKEREKLPEWLTKEMTKVRARCGPSQLGIVVLHEKGKHTGKDMVFISLADYIDWYGTGKEV